ncbi:MAG: hypothetical protein GX967_04575 [Clostridiales bacterium]|nr:hypothetical protein [Clostridiales bacterium]
MSSIIDGIGLEGLSTVCFITPFHAGIDGEYNNSKYLHNNAVINAAIGRSKINFFRLIAPFPTDDTCIITHIPPNEISPATAGIEI